MQTILSLNNYLYARGGAEVVFLEHNRLLADKGWSVVPFSMQHADNLETPWSKYFIEELEFGEDYSLAKKIGMAGKVIYSTETTKNIRALLSEVKPDIAHCHNIYHHISPSVFYELKRQGVPVVLTLHDLKIACPSYKMLADNSICERCKGGSLHNVVLNRCVKDSFLLSGLVWFESVFHRLLKTYTNKVDRLVVPSLFYKEKFVEWGFPESHFVHIPNFIDVDEFEPEFEPGEYFLYFGRLSEEKGLETLIRAAAQSGAILRIAGTGPLEDSLRRLAESLNANVEFLGYQRGKDLHDCIRAARAVVLPSEWYENAPLAIMEAYALGKPVIGAEIGGIPELIRIEETGVVFESRNVAKLAEVLARFVQMPASELSAMGQAGREMIAQDYSSARYIERVTQLYADIGVRG